MLSRNWVAVACVVLTVAVAGRSAEAGDWPTWRHDSGRTAVTKDPLPAGLHLQWVRQLPALVSAWPEARENRYDDIYEPIVFGKSLFVGSSEDDAVTAFDTQTGKQRWRFETEGPVRFAPMAWQDRLYVASDDGCMYCLDPSDGRLLWKCKATENNRKLLGNGRLISRDPVRGAPVVHKDRILFGTGVFRFFGAAIQAVDLNTGKKLATYPYTPHGYLSLAGDRLLVPMGETSPVCIDLNSGQARELAGARDNLLAARGSWAYFKGKILGLDEGAQAPDTEIHKPVLAAKAVYTSVGDAIVAYPSPDDATLTEVTKDGKPLVDRRGQPMKKPVLAERWRMTRSQILTDAEVRPSARVPAWPLHVEMMAGNRLYGYCGHTIFALEVPSTGAPNLAWKTTIKGSPARLLAGDGKLFVVTKENEILCFGPQKAGPIRYGLPDPPAPSAAPDKVHADLLEVAGAKRGYCVMMGGNDPRLAEAMFRQTKLNVVVIEPDEEKARTLRGSLAPLRDADGNATDLPSVNVDWPTTWQVLGPFPQGSPFSIVPAEALKTIPEKWTVDGKTYVTRPLSRAGDLLDLLNIYPGYGFSPLKGGESPSTTPRMSPKWRPESARQVAIAFAKINCQKAGKLTIGFGAEYYSIWYLDGKIIFQTAKGNSRSPAGPIDQVFQTAVSAGEHVLAVKVMGGMAGWHVRSTAGPDLDGLATKPTPRMRRRIVVHPGDPTAFGLPPYMATLMVVDEGIPISNEAVAEIYRVLRPYGGKAFIRGASKRHKQIERAVKALNLANADISIRGEYTILTRKGALSKSSDWTHGYADSANTLMSKDARIKAPFDLLWFGGPSAAAMPSIYEYTIELSPSVIVSNGRLLMKVPDKLVAVDVYTGCILWEAPIPLGHDRYTRALAGSQSEYGWSGAHSVAADDGIYFCHEKAIHRYDPATGKKTAVLPLPDRFDHRAQWGRIRLWQDRIVGTVFQPVRNGNKSELMPNALVAIDRQKGSTLWSATTTRSFPLVALGSNKVFCIDGEAGLVGNWDQPDRLYQKGRFGQPGVPTGDIFLRALDVATGKELWRASTNIVANWISYSREHEVVVLSNVDEVAAFDAGSGKQLWRHKGDGPWGWAILWNDRVINQRVGGVAFHLRSGQRVMAPAEAGKPPKPWTFGRGMGYCGYSIASENLVTWGRRTSFADLITGTSFPINDFRSACRNNLIPACGVLSIPNTANGCACSLPLFTALTLMPAEADSQ